MKKRKYKHYIEIMPAALLLQRSSWQRTARSLPDGACLLVTNPNDKKQIKIMQKLFRSFHDKGRQVIILPVKQVG